MASPDASPAPRASAKDYQRMYFDVRHKPLTVNSVEVKGDERTRPGLFAKVLAPIYEAGTLDELRVKCLEANAVLHSYDIFDRVDVLCDAGPEDAPSNTATVTVDVSEKKKFNLKGGAYVSQSGEGSVEMSAGLNNAFGFAEKVDVEAIKGTSLDGETAMERISSDEEPFSALAFKIVSRPTLAVARPVISH